MIVVGILVPGAAATSSVLEIAQRAAASGARTQVLGLVPIGEAGDRQLVALATAGVGHATVTRSAAAGIDAADLDLALRYLPDVHAIVLVAPAAPLLATALAASAWSGATLIVVGPLDADAAAALDDVAAPTAAAADPGPPRATAGSAAARPGAPIVLDPPARDPDGAFAGVVAALAARLDAGEDPVQAWTSTVAARAIDTA